jgi:hypothetical protein
MINKFSSVFYRGDVFAVNGTDVTPLPMRLFGRCAARKPEFPS